MLRVRDRQRVPGNGGDGGPSGFRYICPHCSTQFHGNSLGRLVLDVKKHRIANNLTISDNLLAEIEDAFCQTRPELCEDSPGTPGPTLLEQAGNFAKSMWRWGKAGFPMVSESVFNHRVSICQSCPHWKGWREIGVGRCKLCGCISGSKSLKLWMGTEKCPDKPTRW